VKSIATIFFLVITALSVQALPLKPDWEIERKFGEVACYRGAEASTGCSDLSFPWGRPIHLPDFDLEYLHYDAGGWTKSRMQSGTHVFAVRDRKSGEILEELRFQWGGYIPSGGRAFRVREGTYVLEMFTTTRGFQRDDSIPDGFLIVWDQSSARAGNSFVYNRHFKHPEEPNQSAQTTPVSAPR